tara:strand:- start:574 stop:1620 length:1047 start_codon:yes stop_codon:yes gene_type:complete
MLLTDIFLLENITILEESSTKGTMKVRGIFQRADEANNNKRVYSKALLESQINKLKPLIEDRRLCGELDHPSNDTVKLSNVSHLVTNLSMKNKDVIGEAELLNTPAGMTAQALIKGGVKIGISSRGLGTLSENEDGTKSVNEDFNLVTFDLVADPSTRGAFPELTESAHQDLHEGVVSVRENMKKDMQGKVFLTLLTNELNTRYLEEGKRAVKAVVGGMAGIAALGGGLKLVDRAARIEGKNRAKIEKTQKDAEHIGAKVPGVDPGFGQHNRRKPGFALKKEAREPKETKAERVIRFVRNIRDIPAKKRAKKVGKDPSQHAAILKTMDKRRDEAARVEIINKIKSFLI